MKILTLLIVFCLLVIVPSLGHSAPFLTCDAYPTTVVQPTEFSITEGTTTVVSPAKVLTDGSVILYYDVQGYSVGNHSLSVKSVKVDPLWGRLESTIAPFAFTRPGNPAAPAGIGLTK